MLKYYPIAEWFPEEVLAKIAREQYKHDEYDDISLDSKGNCPLGAILCEIYGEEGIPSCPTNWFIADYLVEKDFDNSDDHEAISNEALEFIRDWDSGNIDDLEFAFGLN